MSRRAPRYRIVIPATAQPLLGGEMAVCRTRDVSHVGICLDTAAWFPLGTRIAVTLVDPASGNALELIGDVVREATAPSWALGISVIEPPPEWHALVQSAARRSGNITEKPGKRMRVLVVGDEHRQRGAMALYVTSGWDVMFATDASVLEALGEIALDAVIAELDADD
ncbi:MAG: PilZ domain-containing protein, partial [Proteobacteria bacterium]|nr:PilZ domain-containing protein [Pseudomonadota bacterium]